MYNLKITLITLFLFSIWIFQCRRYEDLNDDVVKYEDKNLNINRLPLNGQSFFVKVKRNQTLHVKIIGNPTSGYIWYLNNKKDLEITPLNLDENDSTTPSFERNHYGASAFYDFTFMSRNSIENTRLEFVYKRAWEPNNNPIIINVDVQIE